MKLVNIDYIPGQEFDVLGMVKGNVVQSKNVGKDIGASFKTLVGGELKGYTEMLQEARQIATKRMADEAEALGADAVVNVKFSSAAIMQGAAEVIVYGTAVKFK
ncbi:MAG: YbjQ family protein [Emergencia sp.]|nr:YbjQ family protein [Emergencia sp.]